MAPPDSRRQVGGLCYAKADAVSHDAKRIYGAGLDETWIAGTVTEVVNHRPTGSKRSTTYIIAKYKVGNKEYTKSIPLQSPKAQAPEGPATCPTAEEAGATRTTTNENQNPNVGDDDGTTPAADSTATGTTTPPAGTRTPPVPPLGGTPPTPPTLAAFSNDGRAWCSGDVDHDINGPTTVKMWKMTCQWTGNEYTEGCDNGATAKYTELDCFRACFPKTQLNWMVERLNLILPQHNKALTTLGEMLKWFGILILITRFEFGYRADLWSQVPRCKYIPAPDFGKTGMSRQRWDDLWRHMEWSYQPITRPDDMSSEHYRWCLIQDFIDRINEHRVNFFHPSNIVCVDESISRWYGLGGSWINKGLPHYVAMDRKPEDGCEIQDSCCGKSNIMMRLKLVKSATEEEALG